MNRRLACLLASILVLATLRSPGSAQQPIATAAAENFDIRTNRDATPSAYVATVTSARASGYAAQLVATRIAGLAQLRAAYPALAIANSPALGLPEVVGREPGTGFLSKAGADRVATLRAFLTGHANAFGLAPADVSSLHVVADYQNPAGNMGWAELEQRVNGVPIFQGTVRGGFTASGQLVRTTGVVVPVVDAGALPTAASLSAPHAITLAAGSVGWDVSEGALVEKSTDGAGRISFARAGLANDPRAWLTYFPVAPGVLRLAWATEIIGDPMAYLSVVDALDGTVLFRKNLTNFQSQPATYVVYTGDSPAPLSPTTAIPGSNKQPPAVPRTTVTTIGNEGDNAFNLLGWMTDGTNLTDGNNVQAGLDIAAPDGVDATVSGSGRVFDFAYNPPPGLPAPGDAPTTGTYRDGEVTNMFYWTNVYHDRLYQLGFTEAAHNFQHDNFDRGGIGGDRVRAEAQDYSGSNNANFTTPPDGGRGRMQMYRFTGPTPDRSSGLDQDIMVHELTHGTSNRLHANGTGLDTYMAAGMGEGWSDFYGRALLSTPDEDVNGVYAMAGWATLQMASQPYTDNYYYGIRRFPYAVMSTIGGPSNRPHNPLTFADVDGAEINLANGAYPSNPLIGGFADQVHNMGEVWASSLFEVRARFISRLGHDVGNQRILQFVTDGMKLDPGSPTMLNGRDSILAAAAASGTVADILDIWQGFAARGMGLSASVQNTGNGTGGARVTEAFDVPGLTATSATMVSEAAPNGSFDAGELVGVEFCVTNHSLETIGPVTGTLLPNASLASPSAPADFGTLVSGGSACRTFTFTVAAACGETIAASLDLQAPQRNATVEFHFDSGLLAPFFTENFDSVAALDLPDGWSTSTLTGIANPWGASTQFAVSAPSSAFVADLSGISDSVLESPTISLPAGGSRLTFSNHVETEWFYDGGVLEISIAEGPYQDIEVAGGTFARNGYMRTLYGGTGSGPLGNRRAWTGGFLHTVVTAVDLPPAAAGQDIRLRWRMASDEFLNSVGWAIDNVAIGQFACSVVVPPTAADDTYTATADLPVTVPAPGVLGNDIDEAGNATLVSDVSHGTLALAADGSFTYTPAASFVGVDQFTYTAHNLVGPSNVATVRITVEGVLPTTVGDTYAATTGTTLTVPAAGVLGNDNGTAPLVASLVSNVAHGTLALAADGSFTYTSAPTFVGTDTFTYRAINMAGPGNVASVTLTVTGVSATAVADSYATGMGTTLNTPSPGVLGNDTGTAPLTATLVSDVAHGTLALAADGSFIYTPEPLFDGVDTFTYRTSNVVGSGTTTTVTLTVAAPTVVQPPTGLRVASVVGDRVTLRWTPPAIGPAPTGFVIEGGVAPGETLATIPTGSTAPGFEFDAPTGAFYVRVHSLAGTERSAASNEVRLFVETPTPPSSPTNLLALVDGSTVGLSWRNTFEGGAPTALRLDVTGTINGTLPLGLMENGTITGVPDGTYTLRLRALNDAGASVPSDPITITVPAVCSGAPQPPTNLQTGRIGNVAYVLWDLPPAGPAALSYIVNVSGAFTGSFPVTGRSLAAMIGPGSYHVSVQGANSCGIGAATPVQTITVP